MFPLSQAFNMVHGVKHFMGNYYVFMNASTRDDANLVMRNNFVNTNFESINYDSTKTCIHCIIK